MLRRLASARRIWGRRRTGEAPFSRLRWRSHESSATYATRLAPSQRPESSSRRNPAKVERGSPRRVAEPHFAGPLLYHRSSLRPPSPFRPVPVTRPRQLRLIAGPFGPNQKPKRAWECEMIHPYRGCIIAFHFSCVALHFISLHCTFYKVLIPDILLSFQFSLHFVSLFRSGAASAAKCNIALLSL
jgi:hypothetical protein